MNRHNLFIGGVPATGKSWFGDWLAKERNYLHIDAERNNGVDFDRLGVHNEWDKLLQNGRATDFVDAITKLPKPVVVNWGFPIRFLYVVSALKQEAIDIWWFYADKKMARQAFVSRGAIDPAFFDQQMDDIEREWHLIYSVFKPHIIQSFHLDGSRRSPEELWQKMSAIDEAVGTNG